jgi:hypothetical protein
MDEETVARVGAIFASEIAYHGYRAPILTR